MSLQEEKMRQEASGSGIIPNNEDYMLAKALAMSMDNVVSRKKIFFNNININNNNKKEIFFIVKDSLVLL